MLTSFFGKFSTSFSQIKNWRLLLFTIVCAFSLIIVGTPISLRPSPFSLKVGDVSFQDIRAPRSFSYISEILTNQARDAAEKSVSPVFLPADPSISRKQFELLNQTINQIENIRLNNSLSPENKIQLLSNLVNVQLTQDYLKNILALQENRWIQIKNECLLVFEQIIRSPISEDHLISIKNNIPAHIGFSFSEKEVELIKQLISPFIIVNSVYSNEKTNEAVQIAREKVSQVIKYYASGEMIVFSGQLISPQTWEALQSLGLVQSTNEPLELASAFLLIITTLIVPALFLRQVKKALFDDPAALLLISILFLLFLGTAKLVISNHTILPYLFPIAAFGLTIASIFDYETGIISLIPLSILLSYILTNNVELIVYFWLSSATAIFVLGKGRRLIIFFAAGIVVGLVGSAVIIAFRLTEGYFDPEGLITLIGIAFLNGLGSISLTLLLQYYFALLLGRTTALQLMELSRPDHPLLQFLMINAPGTYQHSLQTANLTEQAARIVKADPLLARVGALYHDVGKATNPDFFIENQDRGPLNTHENLKPEVAAHTIIKHVEDGVTLAKKYGLPPQIINFITEHHGNMIARYQYFLSLKKPAKINVVPNKKHFVYPGQPPRTRETAILMLADGCEARIKAEYPKTKSGIRNLVNDTFNYYILEKQLNNVNLTFRDINLIEDSFVTSFVNAAHKRMRYPSNKTLK
jgi:putative nucleotidyltransferase with HDIG domain